MAAAVLPQILEGIRRQESLPGVSFTVNRVVQVSHAANNGVSDLAGAILSDPSLTQRVLRVANSAAYAWDGGVDTVSKAIMLLGFDTVRMIALSLILLDRLADPKKQRLLQAEVASVLGASIFAMVISEASRHDCERSTIKALLRQMGRLVTAMYATDEYTEIKERASKPGVTESAAAYEVLGVRYEIVAEAAIAEWSLPDEYRKVPTHTGNLEGSALVALVSSELVDLIARHGDDHADVVKVMANRADRLGIPLATLQSAVATAREQFQAVCGALGLPDITRRKSEALLENTAMTASPSARTRTSRASAERNEVGRPKNYREVIFHGISDISAAVAADEPLTTLVRMVVETLADGMGYQRSLFFFRDANRNTYRVRFALGRDAERLQREFSMPLKSPISSVFHAALDRDLCIHIEDTHATKVSQHLPPWFKQLDESRSFVLLPVVAGKLVVGALYADRAMPDPASTPEDLEMLVTLKNQIVLAMKANQRRP